MNNKLLIVVHAFTIAMLKSILVDDTWLPKYKNSSANLRSLVFNA